VFWVDLCVGVIGLHFMRKYPYYWEFWRTATIHWCYRVDHMKEGCGSLEDLWSNHWGSWYVLFSYFHVLSSWGMVSRTLDYVICMGWGIYVTTCKHELEFPWKSNVVLGSCDLKNLRRRRKSSGFKREKDHSDLTP
jgi:hypothetical protein